MEAQVVTIDQPFHSAYEKFIEITTRLGGEGFSDKMPNVNYFLTSVTTIL